MHVIHRYWTGPASPPMEPWLGEALRLLNPSEQVVDWTDDTLPADVVDRADALLVRLEASSPYRARSNVVRLLLLERFGGAWYDHDLIPLVPLEQLPAVATASHREPRCNCFLRFPADHPVIGAALGAIETMSAASSSLDIGERLIDRIAGDRPDIARLFLPFDADAVPNPRAWPWAVHVHATGARVAT